jgi:hypothetical protein
VFVLELFVLGLKSSQILALRITVDKPAISHLWNSVCQDFHDIGRMAHASLSCSGTLI